MSIATPEQRKFAVFDIDGTLFRWQLFHELVFELKNHQYFDSETSLRLDTSFASWRTREASWEDYEQVVIDAAQQNLPLIPPAKFEEIAATVVNRSGKKLYRYTKNLLDQLRDQDYFIIALSGSQQEVVDIFAKLYGFDLSMGTLYERKDGAFTGAILRHVPSNKVGLLREIVNEHSLTFEGSVGVGDSAGDSDMLAMVEQAIAFNPSSELYETAKRKGWKIVIERKNLAYELEKGPHGSYVLACAGIV